LQGDDAILVSVAAGAPVDIEMADRLAVGVQDTVLFEGLALDVVYTVVATNACGNRASATARTAAPPPPPPVYCPSLRLDSGRCSGCVQEIGFAYRNNALRDPAATVALPHCNGEVSYAYPAEGVYGTVRAEVPFYGGGDTVLGYLANQSECAPPIEETASPQNYFSPTVVLPAPSVVAHSMSADGALTTTLSSGAQVVSNPIPTSCG
jgi:hypothetical protein